MDGSESFSTWWTIFLANAELITRVWGVFTAIVLFGVGADLCFIHQLAGGFAIAAAVITLFLETTWAVTILLQICLRWEQHPVRNCWDIVSWIDFWKKTIIYTILAVILFAQPHRAWFSIVGGLMLIALALLHSARWYHAIKNTPMSLLEQHDDGFDDDVEIDITLPDPVQRLDRNQSSPSSDVQNEPLPRADA